ETDALLREPGFFDFVVLGAPAAADWKVTGGRNPPSPPNMVSQIVASRPEDSIAVALRREATFRDGRLSLALQKGFGRGGIVFRMAGPKIFCVLLVHLRTGDARLIAYDGGPPAELARGKAKLPNPWGVLSIAATGGKIVALWDGTPLLEAIDPHPQAGQAGMATAGPGRVSFDEFVLQFSDE
ncbi:MAG TPA: hypothetical protein VGK86_08175, partial [Thermoanaerobaculia bacterium]